MDVVLRAREEVGERVGDAVHVGEFLVGLDDVLVLGARGGGLVVVIVVVFFRGLCRSVARAGWLAA